jgi:hypothetical protein
MHAFGSVPVPPALQQFQKPQTLFFTIGSTVVHHPAAPTPKLRHHKHEAVQLPTPEIRLWNRRTASASFFTNSAVDGGSACATAFAIRFVSSNNLGPKTLSNASLVDG